MIELFSYQFIQHAFIAGLLVAVLCAITGIGVVSRNMSLLGDSLSHLSFGAAAVAVFSHLPFLVLTVPAALFGAIFITKFSKKNNNSSDALVAAISTAGISVGVLVASFTRNVTIDIQSFLFGSILTVEATDLIALSVLFIFVSVGFFVYKKEIFNVLFDAEQAKISGINVNVYQIVISLVTGLVVALSMKIVGALLMSALLVLPAFSAMRLANGFSRSVILSSTFSLFSVTVGMFISFSTNSPTGPVIALCASFIFLVALISSRE